MFPGAKVGIKIKLRQDIRINCDFCPQNAAVANIRQAVKICYKTKSRSRVSRLSGNPFPPALGCKKDGFLLQASPSRAARGPLLHANGASFTRQKDPSWNVSKVLLHAKEAPLELYPLHTRLACAVISLWLSRLPPHTKYSKISRCIFRAAFFASFERLNMQIYDKPRGVSTLPRRASQPRAIQALHRSAYTRRRSPLQRACGLLPPACRRVSTRRRCR